jgi:hypothetical protein
MRFDQHRVGEPALRFDRSGWRDRVDVGQPLEHETGERQAASPHARDLDVLRRGSDGLRVHVEHGRPHLVGARLPDPHLRAVHDAPLLREPELLMIERNRHQAPPLGQYLAVVSNGQQVYLEGGGVLAGRGRVPVEVVRVEEEQRSDEGTVVRVVTEERREPHREAARGERRQRGVRERIEVEARLLHRVGRAEKTLAGANAQPSTLHFPKAVAPTAP